MAPAIHKRLSTDNPGITRYLDHASQYERLTEEQEYELGVAKELGKVAVLLLNLPEDERSLEIDRFVVVGKEAAESLKMLGDKANEQNTAFDLKRSRCLGDFAAGLSMDDSDRVDQLHVVKIEGELAVRQLTESNLLLTIKSAAKRARTIKDSGLGLDDLIQESNLALIKAVDKFDPFKGFRFTTYAMPWLDQAITRAIANKIRVVRLPVKLEKQLITLEAAEDEYRSLTGATPTIEELAEQSGLTVEEIKKLRNIVNIVSLDESAGGESNLTRGDFVHDSHSETLADRVVNRVMICDVLAALKKLSDREKKIIILRFGLGDSEPMTQSEVGELFNVNRQRISHIEREVIKKLRKTIGETNKSSRQRAVTNEADAA